MQLSLSKLKNIELLKAPSFMLIALLFNVAIFILIQKRLSLLQNIPEKEFKPSGQNNT